MSKSTTSNYVWANNVSSKMIYPHKTIKSGKERLFYNMCFSCAKSDSGLAAIALNVGQVKQATHRNGTPNAQYRNVLLGTSGQIRPISIKSKKGYRKIKMSVEDILECFNTARTTYKVTHTKSA